MPFKYHPPTRKDCKRCEEIEKKHIEPVIGTWKGRASSADNFAFHNWYNFVLGYTPAFPNYVIEKEGINKSHFVVDPFMGSGTTMVCCKELGIKSAGIDANDYFSLVAKAKLDWDLDLDELESVVKKLAKNLEKKFASYDWQIGGDSEQKDIASGNSKLKNFNEIIEKSDIEHIPEKYICKVPLAKLILIQTEISNLRKTIVDEKIHNVLLVALSAIAVPSSNVYYGPGFGVRKKARENVDVLSLFTKKIDRMVDDLKNSNKSLRKISAKTYLGDAREMSKLLKPNSVDYMVTSPPYPGDHEYTKHTRLELLFLEMAKDLEEFRTIKKRMLRGSTTNIYKGDIEGDSISEIKEIRLVTDEIKKRLDADGGTSGFEKLYTKLVWEYFGGMFKVFEEALRVLKPGGKFFLLVSDSHAFKMVHIETAEILALVAKKAGLEVETIDLWQHKNSTSHKFKLFEEILVVKKPLN